MDASRPFPAHHSAGIQAQPRRGALAERGSPSPPRAEHGDTPVDDDWARVSVVERDDGDGEIRLDGTVLGSIHRAGRVVVALNGQRHDRATECGQSILWDLALSQLVTTADSTRRQSAWARNQ